MATIEVDIDRYGRVARASCLADFLEVLSLSGGSCTYAQLADLVADRWGMKRQITLLPGESGEVAEEYVDSSWVCLRERAEIMGDAYPFEVDDVRLSLRSGFDIDASSYVALLCMTICHAYHLDAGVSVEQAFEEYVALGLEGVGLTVGRFGDITRRNGMNFPNSLAEMGRQLAIPVDHKVASRRGSANDSGLDVLGVLDWADGRSGRWLFLGQVTCGSSETWSDKLSQVKLPRWKKFLGELTDPIAFLAVPHHVDRRAYFEITEGDGKAIVDRPRLALAIAAVDTNSQAVIAAVRSASVESILV